jgi:serine/threonine-protein kinase HipA
VHRLKTSRDDLLSLLIEAGAECIGDIHVIPESGPTPVHVGYDLSNPQNLRFSSILRESLDAKGAKQPSLPGIQDKVSAAMISLPIRAKQGASYILNLNPESMPRLVENEHFFLRMARASGLLTASATLVADSERQSGLLVERFDRFVESSTKKETRTLRELHQEDACQFLGYYPGDKYLISCSEIARGIQTLGSAPMVDILRFVQLISFSYLIGNGDLHAKNVSLQSLGTRIALTPAYDLLSSLPYGDRSMALDLDGRKDNFKRKGLLAFAARYAVRPAAITAMLAQLCDVASSWIPELGAIGLVAKKQADLTRLIRKRQNDLGK